MDDGDEKKANELKRLNILVPRNLYDRYVELSKDEYKSTTAMVLEWMSSFVKEKEHAAASRKAFLASFSRFGGLLLNVSSDISGEEAKDFLKELATTMLDLVKDPTLCDSPDFISRMSILEYKARRIAPDKDSSQTRS